MQRVIQVGNSAGVLIPRGVLEELGWSVGTAVRVRVRRRGMWIAEWGERVRGAIGSRVAVWVEDFIRKYGRALEDVADGPR